jgi:hypothetical protein
MTGNNQSPRYTTAGPPAPVLAYSSASLENEALTMRERPRRGSVNASR